MDKEKKRRLFEAQFGRPLTALETIFLGLMEQLQEDELLHLDKRLKAELQKQQTEGEYSMATEKEQPKECYGHRKRVDFDDPIVQIIEGMVRELEARPDWNAWILNIFKNHETSYQRRGANKGQPTLASHGYNSHYNSLFHIAVQAFKEGYRRAQEGKPLLVLEAELIADEAWPKEEKKRKGGQDDWGDWWWKSHRP